MTLPLVHRTPIGVTNAARPNQTSRRTLAQATELALDVLLSLPESAAMARTARDLEQTFGLNRLQLKRMVTALREAGATHGFKVERVLDGLGRACFFRVGWPVARKRSGVTSAAAAPCPACGRSG